MAVLNPVIEEREEVISKLIIIINIQGNQAHLQRLIKSEYPNEHTGFKLMKVGAPSI